MGRKFKRMDNSLLGFSASNRASADEGGALAVATQKPEGGANATVCNTPSAPLKDAQVLIAKIDIKIEKLEYGSTSSNYGMDYQYTIKGSYSQSVIAQAKSIWKSKSRKHWVMDPKPKDSGGRNGAKQANFLTFIDPSDDKKGRHNVHVNVTDG